MRTWTFAPFTRQSTAARSRRASMLAFGGATLAAAEARPDIRAARKKSGSDCKKKEKQRCNRDAEACRATVARTCELADGCVDALRCCEGCSADGFLACVFAASE